MGGAFPAHGLLCLEGGEEEEEEEESHTCRGGTGWVWKHNVPGSFGVFFAAISTSDGRSRVLDFFFNTYGKPFRINLLSEGLPRVSLNVVIFHT